MADVTTAFAAKQALHDLLAAAGTLTDVRVTWGGPSKTTEVAREHVWLSDITEYRCDWHAINRVNVPREETFDLPLTVQVSRAGDDEHATEQRAWEILTAVGEVILADVTLGGVVTWALPFRRATPAVAPGAEQGWTARIEARVGVKTTGLR